jgi:DNA-binding transcriptional regulator YhcF (GntR family)
MMNTSTLNQIKPEQNNVFAGLNFLEVDEKSKIPKYMQIVDIILSDIENGIFNIGEQIPSINETSCEFYMARDTVEKAYKILKEKGIITAVKGKGYFVSSTADICNKRILLLLNHFESENKTIYNAFYENLPEGTEIDLYVYNGQPELLEKCIIKSLGAYDYFIILPVLDTHTKDLDNAIKKIPGNKLISIRHELSSAQHAISALVQDDCKNIEEAMNSISELVLHK